jgi:pseudouridine-5'-phosphate glycosidase
MCALQGLSPEGLEKLARAGKQVHKTSRRDLAAVVAGKLNGATTVSGTSYIANLVGISVFATGGIGGVHRGGEVSTCASCSAPLRSCTHSLACLLLSVAMDVSADLTELGRTPIAVVCAGAKSLLDIGRTLEFLVRCQPSMRERPGYCTSNDALW